MNNCHTLKKEMQNNYCNFALSEEQKAVADRFPVKITDYYSALIDRADPFNDPLGRQALPDVREVEDTFSSCDPLGEESDMPVPHLIHRYRDRVVLLATSRCALFCRFCLRKRKWKTDDTTSDIGNSELEKIVRYLKKNSSIHEVIISGGDPLMLSNRRIKEILERLSTIPSIEILRLGTRMPVVLPERIDAELIEILSEIPTLWLMTHFNHPKEITADSSRVLTMLISSGVPVLNQTVLLKGVNDSASTLETLFRALVKLRVKPHYLFHIDPVKGVRHFATGIDCGLKILKEFRKNLSSIAVPTFAIDLPDGGGKISLQPDYTDCNGGFETLNGERVCYEAVL